MKTPARWIGLLLAAVSLASCASNSYRAPAGEPGSQAVITSKAGKDIYTYESFLVEQVDGLPVRYTTRYPGDQEIPLAPGPHELTLKATVRRGIPDKPRAILVTFPLKAAAGRRYVTNGFIEGNGAVVWIEDAGTRKPVTEKKRVTLLYLTPASPAAFAIPVPTI